MSKAEPLKCQKCGKPLGYVTVTAKNFLVTAPTLDNLKLAGTCIDCSSKNSFYRRNF